MFSLFINGCIKGFFFVPWSVVGRAPFSAPEKIVKNPDWGASLSGPNKPPSANRLGYLTNLATRKTSNFSILLRALRGSSPVRPTPFALFVTEPTWVLAMVGLSLDKKVTGHRFHLSYHPQVAESAS